MFCVGGKAAQFVLIQNIFKAQNVREGNGIQSVIFLSFSYIRSFKLRFVMQFSSTTNLRLAN